jgi:hypothetical protein
MTKFDDIPEQFGPAYTIGSAALQKYRKAARDGLASLSPDQRRAYAEAIEKAILSAQRSQLRSAAVPERRPTCASGTWHTTGNAINKAVREQHRAALAACPAKVRRERSPQEWRTLYNAAMAEKHARMEPEQAQAA